MKAVVPVLSACLCLFGGASALQAQPPAAKPPSTFSLAELLTPAPESKVLCTSGGSVTTVASPSGSGYGVTEDLSTPACSGPRYTAGHEVCIEAFANEGYKFNNWTGAYCPCNGFPGPPDYPPLLNCWYTCSLIPLRYSRPFTSFSFWA